MAKRPAIIATEMSGIYIKNESMLFHNSKYNISFLMCRIVVVVGRGNIALIMKFKFHFY